MPAIPFIFLVLWQTLNIITIWWHSEHRKERRVFFTLLGLSTAAFIGIWVA